MAFGRLLGSWSWCLGFVFICLHSAHPACAQSDNRLQGTVLDESNSPIQGAKVLAVGTLWGAITDQEGHFSLGPLSAGRHTLLITAEGFQDLTREVLFKPDSTASLEFILTLASIPIPHHSPLTHIGSLPDGSVPGLPARMAYLPGTIPLRFSGLDLIPTVRGQSGQEAAVFVDGVRMLEAPGGRVSSLALHSASMADQVFVAAGPYGANWGPGVQGGWHVTSRYQSRPWAELMYDSRMNGLRTGALLSSARSSTYGEISGVYFQSDDYTDGSKNLHMASTSAGRVQARGRFQLGSGHTLEGRGAYEVRSLNRDLRKNMQVVHYQYVRPDGVLEGVSVYLARQEWTGSAHAAQQSVRIAMRWRPRRAWRFQTGADYLRLPHHDLLYQSAFARLARGGRRLQLMFTGRGTHASLGDKGQFGWHYQASAAIKTVRAMDVIIGMGQYEAFGQATLTQMDAGLLISHHVLTAQIRTWTRWQDSNRGNGIDADLKLPIMGQSGQVVIAATLSSDKQTLPFWGHLEASWTAPGNFLVLGTRLSGAASIQDEDVWADADAWLRLGLLRRITLWVTAKNLFDATYRWIGPDTHLTLPEPGRSLNLAVRYSLEGR